MAGAPARAALGDEDRAVVEGSDPVGATAEAAGDATPDAAVGEADTDGAEPAPMTAERLWRLLDRERLTPDGDVRNASFYVGSVRVFAIVDPRADRMRFAVPVRNLEDVAPEELVEMLRANYAATMDLRFAVNRGVVWLLYLHPLSSLTERDALSAINQIARHAREIAGG